MQLLFQQRECQRLHLKRCCAPSINKSKVASCSKYSLAFVLLALLISYPLYILLVFNFCRCTDNFTVLRINAIQGEIRQNSGISQNDYIPHQGIMQGVGYVFISSVCVGNKVSLERSRLSAEHQTASGERQGLFA